PVRPGHLEFGERLAGGYGLLKPMVDIRDHCAPVLSFSIPLNSAGVDPYRLISLRYCGKYSHERPGTDKWHQERRSVTAVRQEILEQVHAGRDLRPTLSGYVHLHPVRGIGEGGAALFSFDIQQRLMLDRRAQSQGADHLRTVSSLDPDHRGVIAVDGIGPVEIRLHRLDVIPLAAAPNGER